ncbi:CaiB/BaiF CoA-transferase family protein [Sphingomonas bacterium]|uniref:CaiB/BaiF CoA transferase family protein n=1 Tax=Sphingomonas bacterium TaxID=1895847 RepID=UPI001577428F|nr:CoA transferase [Sphingomonas bacterium]
MSDLDTLPLADLKVVEFTHMVMGPSTGLILGDMGAEVIRIEPIGGDRTRRLLGSGAGYYPMYNRNKQSACLDLKSSDGVAAARLLASDADIVIENFRPGTLDRLGLGYEALAEDNPRLIYCSAKGFLAGPYENRAALDEVAQMMGGLAYMTGPPGRPLRAGASVIDVTGGMFGVIGIMGLLERRHRTGKGGRVKCSLFETTAFLVGQHMAQKAVTGQAAAPMPARISAWAIYDVFTTAGDGQIFIGVVSDQQWVAFCAAFGLDAFAADESLALNNDRVLARERILPTLRALFVHMNLAELLSKCEAIGLPVAPIARPQDLFEDPHLNAAGGLVDMTLADGTPTRLPALPVEIDGRRFGVRRHLGAPGADTRALLLAAGMTGDAVDALFAGGSVA